MFMEFLPTPGGAASQTTVRMDARICTIYIFFVVGIAGSRMLEKMVYLLPQQERQHDQQQSKAAKHNSG